MGEQVHDKRQWELRWPGERVACPKCHGTRTVHRSEQHAREPGVVIGGQRVVCSACGGSGKVRRPIQANDSESS